MNYTIDQTVHIHMQTLAKKTIQHLYARDLRGSRQYIRRAEAIYDNSNEHFRHIVAHDFIWPVSVFIQAHYPDSYNLLPENFKTWDN